MAVATRTLGSRLSETRHGLYVGRRPELARFQDALDSDALPFHVAHVYGPGGIGKTSLLDEVARLAERSGAVVGRVDARDVAPSPAAFEAAVEQAWGPADGAGRRVLLIDTYERLGALDRWVRRTFVPGLRDTDLVVIAGQGRPSHEWRSEWAGQVAWVPLRNLSPDEARDYLGARGVGDGAVGDVLAFTHGHPLALALVAEWACQSAAGSFDPTRVPDLVGDLLARFVSTVPTPAHRAALEGASVVRSLTVPLLRALLGPDEDAVGLFGWLRGLAFTESDADGIRLHDIVRETVEADLRWRDPELHQTYHVRARQAYGARLQEAASADERRRALGDYADLYRHNPVVRPLLRRLRSAWADAGLEGSGPLRDGDPAAVRALAARHHGEAEAEAVARWLELRPDAAEVFYGEGGGVAGYLLTLDLSETTADERGGDPVAAAAWAAVGGRLREGERALVFRSWLDAEAGQGVSVVQSLVFAQTVERYLTTPRLATSLILTSEPETWAVVLQFVGLHRWPDAEAEGPLAGGAPLAAFGKDWRATPPSAWLDALAERTPSDEAPPPPDEAVVVLSEEAFSEAVRDALKAYARPHRLSESPLLRARLVREVEGDPVEALRQLIADAAGQLDRAPRERPYFQALDLTYLHPAPTQALASERLNVPFSTYRRHLGRGVDHVTEALWRAETGDDRPAEPRR